MELHPLGGYLLLGRNPLVWGFSEVMLIRAFSNTEKGKEKLINILIFSINATNKRKQIAKIAKMFDSCK